MREPIIWLDGKWVEAKPSLLQSLTPGVLKSKGVFETMRVANGKVVLLDVHLKRMSRGLKVLDLTRPKSLFTIRGQISQLLKVNRLKNARARLMVWQKAGRVHCAIICEPIKPLTARQHSKGFKGMLVNEHRRKTSVPIKSLDYAIFRDSLQKARAAGFDEALFLNRKGDLAEGSRTNIFLVKDKVLCTPPITSGCLPGVTRQAVLERARKLKLRCATKPLKAQDLFEADEAFLTNALIGIMPLTGLDKQQIGTGKPGPVTLRLREAYDRFIGLHDLYGNKSQFRLAKSGI